MMTVAVCFLSAGTTRAAGPAMIRIYSIASFEDRNESTEDVALDIRRYRYPGQGV